MQQQQGPKKLNWDQVHEIRRKYADGVSIADLAHDYNVGCDNIRRIIKRETWK